MDKPTCTIDGCDKPRLARQKCRKHYRQEVPEAYRHRVEKRTTSVCITCGESFEHVRKAKSGKCRSCLNAAKRVKRGTAKWPSCPVRFIECPQCLALFAAHGPRKYCTPECAKEASAESTGNRNRPCRDCGQSMGLLSFSTYCPDCAKTRHRANQRKNKTGNHRHRARLYGVAYEPITPRKVFEREGWMCWLCDKATDPTAHYLDDTYPTLDHVVPMSKGGAHLLSNVRTACRACNTLKGASLLTRG